MGLLFGVLVVANVEGWCVFKCEWIGLQEWDAILVLQIMRLKVFWVCHWGYSNRVFRCRYSVLGLCVG